MQATAGNLDHGADETRTLLRGSSELRAQGGSRIGRRVSGIRSGERRSVRGLAASRVRAPPPGWAARGDIDYLVGR